MPKIAFVCVGNAGRSQLAAGLAERERDIRQFDVEILSGGMDPGEVIYDSVRTALLEIDVDLGDRRPRQIQPADLIDADHVISLGPNVDPLLDDAFSGEVHTWEIDANDQGLPAVRSQRETLSEHVSALFDDLEEDSG